METAPWEPVEAEPAIAWISQRLLEVGGRGDRGWRGNAVGCALPTGFAHYVKVFHSIWEDTTVTDRAEGWSHAAMNESSPLDDLPTLPSFVPSSGASTNLDAVRRRYRRVRWQELCARYGKKFHPELSDPIPGKRSRVPWPRYLIGAAHGTLDDDELCALLIALRLVAADEPVYFYWDMLKTLHIDRDGDPICMRGSLRAMPANWPADLDWSPTYIWPHDRAWVVTSDYDLGFTLVACNAELRTALMNQPQLECIDIPWDARIDSASDQINK